VNELLVVDKVSKRFQGSATRVQAVQSISFSLAEGEFVCLLGPSGSGKSTLLRIVGGLLAPDSGTVSFCGELVTEPRADIGFVFQKNNLMPWRTVLQNVLLPVEVQQSKISTTDRQLAHDLLALVGLAEFAAAYPSQLSGGMNQRVALARALIHRPQLLLMDEPFGALDALTRERLNVELLRIHQLQATTILMVTHDISEAVFLADRVLLLSERPGRLVAELPIDLPRPRQVDHLGSQRFGELTMLVRKFLGETVSTIG
jgi:NitT/TauT family transport system ATP-binding protein